MKEENIFCGNSCHICRFGYEHSSNCIYSENFSIDKFVNYLPKMQLTEESKNKIIEAIRKA